MFTDIAIPELYYLDVLKRQAVVNPHLKFVFRNETPEGMTETVFCYENGITDYVAELAEDKALTSIQSLHGERRGKDRSDKPEYKVLLNCAYCFSSSISRTEYYHNSSWLEYGGAPDKAVRSAFVSAIDAYLKQNNKYNKNESRISFQDVSDSLI